jgi:uncharacterized protein (DUF1684 family)
MKTRSIVILILFAIVIAIVYYTAASSDDSNYAAIIESKRKDRERYLRMSDESPIVDKKSFKGLNYFPADAKYRVVADVTPVDNGKTLVLAASDGSEQRYTEYAFVAFRLDGEDNKLLILEPGDGGPLFIAFADNTSADETYGGGRYLDVEKKPGASTITLDFNLAYNPYCAYNDSFVCPLPPPGNLLNVPIRAGEKTWH